MTFDRTLRCKWAALLVGVTLFVNCLASAAEFQPTAQDRFVPKEAKAEVIWNDGDFTEGPTVTAYGDILFSDIGNRIMRFEPKSGEVSVWRKNSGKTNGLMFDQQGRLIACEGAAGGNRRISITGQDGKVRTLARSWQGKRFNSPNDLAIDSAGRVYFTDPRYGGDEPREIPFEGVFRVDPDGTVTLVTRDLQKPNGILVSIDGKHLFVADNNPGKNRHLVSFAITKGGKLAGKKILFDFGTGRGIDGMTLDRDGNIYATAGSGAAAGIYVFNPEGKHLAMIPTPGDPTNCVFGIGRDAGTLYITAAGPKPTEKGQERRYALYRVRLKSGGHHIFPKAK
ncbi:MAG: SMP-30/gluconolactonase/LRE family protein [Planctomycetes bacterium]|nr:SMP-30/gluconolactonase/LRE family protein [Planctomycetota bacterium]